MWKQSGELTADGINDHILDMISFAGDYIGSLQLNWTRNKTINDTSITTKQKRVRPDVTIYCNGLLVMMGEEKDVKEKLDIAAQQLDGYFRFWNPLAFGRLPFIMAFTVGGTYLQFYYYYVDSTTTGNIPRREKVAELLALGTQNRINNYKVLQYTINFIRIIQTLAQNQCINVPKLKLFVEIQRPSGTITLLFQNIIKKYIGIPLLMKIFIASFTTKNFHVWENPVSLTTCLIDIRCY